MLVRYIKDTRDMLASMNLPKTIPVGNSDAGSFFSTEVLSNVDYGVSYIHHTLYARLLMRHWPLHLLL